MSDFDFDAAAELYVSPRPGMGNPSSSMTYRRFSSAAQAIQFVMEELSPIAQNSAVLEVGEHRFDVADIRALYDSERYPLKRKSK